MEGDKDKGEEDHIDDQFLEMSSDKKDAAFPHARIIKQLQEEIRREKEREKRRAAYKSLLVEIEEKLKELQKIIDKGSQERRDRQSVRKLTMAESRRQFVLHEEEKNIYEASSDDSFLVEFDKEIRQEKEKEEREKAFQHKQEEDRKSYMKNTIDMTE